MRGGSYKFRTGGVKCYPDLDEILKLDYIAIQKITTTPRLLEQIITDYIAAYESEHGPLS